MPRIKRYLDAVDIEILKILSKNCRTPLGEIAKKVGISIPMIRKRIRTLEKIGILRGCKASISSEMLVGIKMYIIIISGIDPDIISKKIMREAKGVEYIFVSRRTLSTIIYAKSMNNVIEQYIEKLRAKYENIDIRIYQIDSIEHMDTWIPEKPGIEIIYRCIYCGGVIMGTPYIVEKNSIILTFHGKECAKAYEAIH